MNKNIWVVYTCLDSFTPTWKQPMLCINLLIFSVSGATVIECVLIHLHFQQLYSKQPHTIRMDYKWILRLTINRPVLAVASFRCWEFEGQPRVITSLPVVAAVATAREVCAEFPTCLANSMARTFVLKWLSSKKRVRKVCVYACAPKLPATAQKMMWQPLN